MTDKISAPETTPYDPIWSYVGSTLLSAAVAIYFYLSSGVFGLFDGPSGQLEDANVVAVSYIGGLILSFGLAALATIALLALKDESGKQIPAWPRFRLLEGSEGPRPRVIARISLTLLLLLPMSSLYACAYKYVRKSVISEWSGTMLGIGFLDSRRAATSYDCPPSGACLRMHPHEGAPEWFILSDPIFVSLIFVATGLWSVYTLMTLRRRSA